MASATLTMTDTMRASSMNASAAGIQTLSYLSTFNVSSLIYQELVMLTTTNSDTILSSVQASNIQFFQLVATDTVRVNLGGIFVSQFSYASAGLPLTFLAFAGSNISGPGNIHLAYSGSTSATVRMLYGM